MPIDRDTVIRLAQEARLGAIHLDDGSALEALQGFANLLEAQVREDCAQVAERERQTYLESVTSNFVLGSVDAAERIAAAIRSKQ